MGRHVEGIHVLQSNNKPVMRQPQGGNFPQTPSLNDAWRCFSAGNIIANHIYLFFEPLRCVDHKFAATSVRTPAPVGVPRGKDGELDRDGELNMEGELNIRIVGWVGAHGRRKEQGRYLSLTSTGKQR